MSRLEISKSNLQWTIDNHANYDFPAFMRELRLSLGLTKKVVAVDLGMEYQHLFKMEEGYGMIFKDVILRKLSQYFDVPFSLLQFKRDEFDTEKAKKKKAA